MLRATADFVGSKMPAGMGVQFQHRNNQLTSSAFTDVAVVYDTTFKGNIRPPLGDVTTIRERVVPSCRERYYTWRYYAPLKHVKQRFPTRLRSGVWEYVKRSTHTNIHKIVLI